MRLGPSPASLASSVVLHASLIGWMFFGPSLSTSPTPPEKNIYQQLIEPNEKKLVWYNFKEKLPEVSPLERRGISRPPRTQRRTDKQTIVANSRKPGKAKQMVYLPAPPRELGREVVAPNLFAFAAPKLPPPEARPAPKLYAPPPEVIRSLIPPELPEPPKLEAAELTRPKPKEFTPPQEAERKPAPPPAVPEPPRVAATTAKVNLPQTESLPKPKPKEFVPPREAQRPPASVPSVPDAPNVPATTAKLDLPEADRLPRPKPKEFVPPREAKRGPARAPAVPDAPRVAPMSAKLNLPQAEALPRPKPKEFVPPREAKRGPSPAPAVPDAPRVGPTSAKLNLPQAESLPRPKPKEFVPPPEAKRGPGSAPAVPDVPAVGMATAGVTLPQPGALPRPKPREFTPPASSKPSPGTPAPLPDAPQVASAAGPGALQKSFVPPAEPPSASASLPQVEAAPALDPAASPGSLTAAIVGLHPADKLTELPNAASTAQFSSGPKRLEEGGKGEPVESARIFVPDLMIRDAGAPQPQPGAALVQKVVKAAAAPTSAANLDEASRAVPILRSEARLPGITQVHNAPDPRFTGRIIYMVAIQMPNVTSYIGSWTMWFADREPMPGLVREMRAPVPTHKVDPKYVASAAAERVEGKVQLSAVIRADGRIDSITVLQHLDDRLDFSATQALQKWEFQAARRNGRPIDVDAIFEIPFRLEPLATR